MKSILDCRYRGRPWLVLVVCCNTSQSDPSSSAIVSLAPSFRVSLVQMRASSTIFARVARKEWGQSRGPLALDTPLAILSNRFDGGTGPLKGVSK